MFVKAVFSCLEERSQIPTTVPVGRATLSRSCVSSVDRPCSWLKGNQEYNYTVYCILYIYGVTKTIAQSKPLTVFPRRKLHGTLAPHVFHFKGKLFCLAEILQNIDGKILVAKAACNILTGPSLNDATIDDKGGKCSDAIFPQYVQQVYKRGFKNNIMFGRFGKVRIENPNTPRAQTQSLHLCGKSCERYPYLQFQQNNMNEMHSRSWVGGHRFQVGSHR